jgi:mercuric ion binding protein
MRGYCLFFSLLAAVVPAHAGERVVTLEVNGMTCSTCPLTVRQVLRGVKGVRLAKVDMKAASAEVTFNDAMTSPVDLAKAVSEAGFPSRPRTGAR